MAVVSAVLQRQELHIEKYRKKVDTSREQILGDRREIQQKQEEGAYQQRIPKYGGSGQRDAAPERPAHELQHRIDQDRQRQRRQHGGNASSQQKADESGSCQQDCAASERLFKSHGSRPRFVCRSGSGLRRWVSYHWTRTRA